MLKVPDTTASVGIAAILNGDCIEFYKLTVFTVNAAERPKYYLMCSVSRSLWGRPSDSM